MKDPVDHILRPQLPWRDNGGITECGLDSSKVPVLTREQYLDRLKDAGRRRTVMMTCMTCYNTADRWSTWEDDARQALGREIQWETSWGRRDRGCRLLDELHAIAALIEAHREEFDDRIAEIRGRRAWNEKKAASEAAKLRTIPKRRL